jgi:hypothetical protein
MAFNVEKQCCFCGADNSNQPRGYAGERLCVVCGKGGNGEPDEPSMAYRKRNYFMPEPTQ